MFEKQSSPDSSTGKPLWQFFLYKLHDFHRFHREIPQGFDGLAHLLEHSMFLGSKNFPERCEEGRWVKSELGQFALLVEDVFVVLCTYERDDCHWSCATANVLVRPEEYAIIIKYTEEISYTTYAHYISFEKVEKVKSNLFILQFC